MFILISNILKYAIVIRKLYINVGYTVKRLKCFRYDILEELKYREIKRKQIKKLYLIYEKN